MLETLLREMDEEGMGDDSGETVVHDNEQARRINAVDNFTSLQML